MKVRILIVDDDPEIVDGITLMLREKEPVLWEVVGKAHDGLQGFDAAVSLRPDIIVTDIKMPRCNGLDMLRDLTESDLFCEYIILSGYTEFEYAKKAMRLGIRHFLTKPVDEEELYEAVEKAAEVREATRALRESVPRPEEDDLPERKNIIDEAREYIRTNYNRNISLNDIGERFFMNPYYFAQLFKKKTGKTFLKYLTELRIERAKALLLKTDMKVYEICREVGYTDPNYFGKLFERMVGEMPSNYRTARRADNGPEQPPAEGG